MKTYFLRFLDIFSDGEKFDLVVYHFYFLSIEVAVSKVLLRITLRPKMVSIRWGMSKLEKNTIINLTSPSKLRARHAQDKYILNSRQFMPSLTTTGSWQWPKHCTTQLLSKCCIILLEMGKSKPTQQLAWEYDKHCQQLDFISWNHKGN